jgi:hypothetical protein
MRTITLEDHFASMFQEKFPQGNVRRTSQWGNLFGPGKSFDGADAREAFIANREYDFVPLT